MSPCSRTFSLQSSGSSTPTTGAGVDLTEAGELEPTSLRKPPGKSLNSQRDCFLGGSLSCSTVVASTIGSNFSELNSCADFSLANMRIIGQGSTSIRLPR